LAVNPKNKQESYEEYEERTSVKSGHCFSQSFGRSSSANYQVSFGLGIAALFVPAACAGVVLPVSR
jgi:hypothetical protein